MDCPVSPDKVAVYIRWSTEDQAHGTTLEVQREGCTHYVRSQGWQVRDDLIFIDDGYSGGSLDRPGLTALRQAVDQGMVECVVVLKLDRLSRSVVDMVRLVMEEWGDRCWVKSAREPIDTISHAGRVFFYTLASFAEWERSVIRERTFAGKTRRAEQGRNPGFRPPYGYSPGSDRNFVVDETEAAVVRRLFERYASGCGARLLADELNRTGPPFRGGRRWTPQTVLRILANPMYAGDLVWGVRRYNPNHGRRPGEVWWPRNRRPLVTVPGGVPAIVSREMFEQVQQARARRPAPRRGKSGRSHTSPYLLSGLVTCGHCGRTMSARRRGGTPHLAYYCCTARLHGCRTPYVRMESLDRLMESRLLERYGPQAAHVAAARAVEALQSRHAELQARQSEARRRAAQLKEQAARIRQQYRERSITLREYRDLLRDIRQERRQVLLDARRINRALRRMRLPAAGSPGALLPAPDSGHRAPDPDPGAMWAIISPEERRTLMRMLLVSATVRLAPDSAVICQATWRTANPKESKTAVETTAAGTATVSVATGSGRRPRGPRPC